MKAKEIRDDGLLFIDFKNASKDSKIVLFTILTAISILLLLIITKYTLNKMIWSEKLNAIRNFNVKTSTFYINDSLIQTPTRILKSLQGYKDNLPNHTHPDERIDIRIESPNKTVFINLRRDSYNKNQYWIFDYQYQVSSGNEIGIITIDELNGF